MMANIPAVFLGSPAAGDIKLGDLLRGYEAGIGGRLGQGVGTVTTMMYPHD